MSSDRYPDPPKPPPPTLLEQYGSGAEMVYRYGIEIANGAAHRAAVDEMLKNWKRK